MRTHSHEALVRTLEFAPIPRVIWPVYRGGHLDLVTRLESSACFLYWRPVCGISEQRHKDRDTKLGHTCNVTCCDWSVELIAAHADHVVAIKGRARDGSFREFVATSDDVTLLEILTAERSGGCGGDLCFATAFNLLRYRAGSTLLKIFGHRVLGGWAANRDQIVMI